MMTKTAFTVLVFVILLAVFPAVSAAPLEISGTLEGTACWPDGTDETTASYLYRYSYPLLGGEDEVSLMINDFYRYAVSDAIAFTVPINGGMLSDTGVQCSTDIKGEVTCNNDDFFSVCVHVVSDYGTSPITVVSGHTFARKGAKAGSAISLPRLLGILEDEEADEWMKDRQTNKANELVWGMIWDELQRRSGLSLYEDLTYEDFQFCFYPEEDFYLDGSGNPVFFIQAGAVADMEDGILLFPFLLEDILDEL